MSLWISEKYLKQLGPRLEGFTDKGNHRYNCRCSYCGDSAKNKNKKRGYFFQKGGTLLYFCQNCGISEKFSTFLYKFDYSLYKQFTMEMFKENLNKDIKGPILPVETRKYIPNIFSGLENVKNLPLDNECRMIADERKLPVQTFDFYFAPNFIEWSKGNSDKFKNWKGEDHPRMVIPWRCRDGHIIGYSARSLHKEDEPRYYRIFIDSVKEHFFGLDRIDEKKQVFVLEGELDSLMIPNAVAIANGKLHVYHNAQAIYVPDADKRNPHICKIIKDMIDLNLKVCLMPDGLPDKDLNGLVQAGWSQSKILDMIKKNTFQGLEAQLKFNMWRIVK